jgi:hypothetical protein
MEANRSTNATLRAILLPICSSSLLEDVGLLGERPAVQKILRNTYSFPPDTDRYTIYLLQEACKIFQHMTPGEVVEMVSGKDFQDSWKRAREKTSSSHSELHLASTWLPPKAINSLFFTRQN